MSVLSFFLRWRSSLRFRRRAARTLACGEMKPTVLVLGIYLADRPNLVEHLVESFASSRDFLVDQQWIALLGAPPNPDVAAVTVFAKHSRTPKFTLINYLLASNAWRLYDFVVISDDDIALPDGFLDRYLAIQGECGFALAQPARTHGSYIDHPITEQVDNLRARETRFVEIGPLFSVTRDFMPTIAPFDESAPMGWGLDSVWPVIAGRHGDRLGIVDETPVEHSMRKPVSSYDHDTTYKRMHLFLEQQPHLMKGDSQVIINTYPLKYSASYDSAHLHHDEIPTYTNAP